MSNNVSKNQLETKGASERKTSDACNLTFATDPSVTIINSNSINNKPSDKLTPTSATSSNVITKGRSMSSSRADQLINYLFHPTNSSQPVITEGLPTFSSTEKPVITDISGANKIELVKMGYPDFNIKNDFNYEYKFQRISQPQAQGVLPQGSWRKRFVPQPTYDFFDIKEGGSSIMMENESSDDDDWYDNTKIFNNNAKIRKNKNKNCNYFNNCNDEDEIKPDILVPRTQSDEMLRDILIDSRKADVPFAMEPSHYFSNKNLIYLFTETNQVRIAEYETADEVYNR